MPHGTRRLALAKRFAMSVALVMAAGCTPGSDGRLYAPVWRPATAGPPTERPQAETGLQRLASSIATVLPGTEVLSAPPGPDGCARSDVAVVHVSFPERVLFATAADQPTREADPILDFVAATVRRDAPAAELTVLGHTDAVGSDAYNIGLSRRRAETVLRALVARGLPPQRLSTVAIGKRQPIADDATPEGRARNRRVEFLFSPCLSANMKIIERVTSNPASLANKAAEAASNTPAEVLRLVPAGADSYQLKPVGTVSLNQLTGNAGAAEPRPLPAAGPARGVQQPARPSRLLPSARAVNSMPSPAYEPKPLAPDAERNPLGPAVSY